MNKRIIGIDVARALAVIGMIIVNFKIVFGQTGSQLTKLFAELLEGKAAATFVVLAGVGIAFMSNSAIENNSLQKIKNIQFRLVKKSIFLFIVGLLYISIWTADILHFYGIYMIITLFLLKKSKNIILGTSLLLIFIYPLLITFFSYDTGWDFKTYEYANFWSIIGFFRNLFYNGFHPVIPWVSFMLIGLWFGKQDLHNETFIKKSIWVSLGGFIITLILSKTLIFTLSNGSQIINTELTYIFGTNPMPPLPIYMISGSSIALFVISLSIFISKRYKKNKIIIALNKTGQLALTFYVAHVLIGMGIIEFIYPDKMGKFSIEFSVLYALLFSLASIIFAVIWTKYFKTGPLEWLMRKLTN